MYITVKTMVENFQKKIGEKIRTGLLLPSGGLKLGV